MLPRGQAQGAAEKGGNADIADRRNPCVAAKQHIVGNVGGDDVTGEDNERRAAVTPKGIRLRRPVEIPCRPGEAVEVVLGGLVIAEGRYLDSSLIRRSSSAIA